MISVVSHAQPAELITALGAGHMHATAVFLDIGFAFWASLSIKLDPLLVGIRA
jgi:hypothetical protein